MGGTVSSGDNNEELVDNLVLANYITKPEVERVFRAVDRGHFFPDDADVSDLPYRDVAWRAGHIHISAPCIYSEVMENLEVEPGLSFLNVGSGTGYLNTMVGLLLGASGVNHGVDIYEDVIAFSEQRVRLFIAGKGAGALDRFELCPPRFVCGNGLLLPQGTEYDRVYCGAACNELQTLEYLKGLVKVGGLLICPVHSELVLFRRTALAEWKSKVLLPVAFAELIPAAEPFMRVPVFPHGSALPLEDTCRLAVRRVLRRAILAEHPEFVQKNVRVAARAHERKKRKARNQGSDSDEETDSVRDDFYSCVSHRVKLDSGIVEDIEESDLESVDWECDGDGAGTESDSDLGATPPPPRDTAPTFSELMHTRIKSLDLPKPLLHYLGMGHVPYAS